MIALKNITIQSKLQKPVLIDVFYLDNTFRKPIVVFCHGYKGFKDWGAWNIMAKQFAEAGFCFIKFNFSHNGGTLEQPIDFPDLEAFGNNNYSIELDDLDCVLNWIYVSLDLKTKVNFDDITLIGHSRGGGIAVIKSEEDYRIKKLITLDYLFSFIREIDTHILIMDDINPNYKKITDYKINHQDIIILDELKDINFNQHQIGNFERVALPNRYSLENKILYINYQLDKQQLPIL